MEKLDLRKTNTEEWEKSPLPLEVIPNNMGINLCSVKDIKWSRKKDGQLKKLVIDFMPSNEK